MELHKHNKETNSVCSRNDKLLCGVCWKQCRGGSAGWGTGMERVRGPDAHSRPEFTTDIFLGGAKMFLKRKAMWLWIILLIIVNIF